MTITFLQCICMHYACVTLCVMYVLRICYVCVLCMCYACVMYVLRMC